MFFSSAEAFAVPLLMLFATPLLLNNLGETRFGIWAWINAAAAFCGLFNFGLAESVQTLASKHPNNSSLYFGNVFASGITTLLALFFIGTIILVLQNTTVLPNTKLGELFLPLITATLFFSLRFLENTVLSFFKAHLHYAHSSIYSFSSKLFGLGTNIILLMNGASFEKAYFTAALITLAFIFSELIHVTLKYSLTTKGLKAQTIKEEIVLQKHFLTHSWVQNFATISNANIDKLAVGTLMSPTLLAHYSIGSMLISQVHLLFSSAFQVIIPEFSSTTMNQNAKKRRYIEYTALLIICFLGISALLTVQDHQVIRWWLKENAPGVIKLVPLFLLFELFFILNVVPYYTLVSARKVSTVNQILLPTFGALIVSTCILKFDQDITQFMLVRSFIILMGSLAFHWMGAKLVFKNS